MFEQWLADDGHWREEQEAIYRRRAHYWSPFHAYIKRVYGGKYFVPAIFQVGLSWLPNGQGGISPQDALARFLDLLQRILGAKKRHANNPNTKRAQKDSGDHRGHSFRDTDRGDLRDERHQALLRLLQGGRLHQEMAGTIVEDGHYKQNSRNNWDPKAKKLWYDWNAGQKQLYNNYSAGGLSSEYLRLKEEYHDKCTTATVKRFHLGPPGGF